MGVANWTMKQFLLVLVVLLGVAFAEVDHSFCNKVTNATDCTWYDDSDFALIGGALENAQPEPQEEGNYKVCATILFTKVCVHVDVADLGNFFSNVTLSITIEESLFGLDKLLYLNL